MAEMDLRAYINEIDELIERNQLDEAIAHCRQILQVYPKHLGSYRLLGKAYLEAKRFGDAADIFQRVLSAIPDDFVSHIGMAIVREDEGNLDSAIWHMERAFETNPANPAIRQELSRLIGRRDGLEPHKIRLTRGALARQYAQGELYVQAIAELRSALGEDPDRPDLEVLLGKMYWMADQHAEAQVVFEQILEKLPYCLEANRYMAAILHEQNKEEEARRYHRHLAALDPYFAFVESATIDPKTIDAKAVRIERTDWVPGQPLPTAESGTPEWVASLGVDLSDESPDPIDVDDSPPWLAEIYQSTTAESNSPGVTSDAAESDPDADPEGEIPQWMEEAGWVPSNGNLEEGPISFSDAELESEAAMTDDTGELTPADIPGWIQDIAPENIDESSEAEESAEEPGGKTDFVPEWLSSIASDAEDVTPDPTPPSAVEPQEDPAPVVSTPEKPDGVDELSQEEPATEEDSPELPTWIEPQSPGATSTIITWLDDRPGEDSEAEKATIPMEAEAEEEPAQETSPDAAVPSWMDAIADGDTIPDVQTRAEKSEPESPSWLAGLAEAASQQEIDPPPPASTETPDDPKDEAAPEWLEGISELDAEPASVPSTDDAPDWLQGIAEPEPAGSADTPVSEPGAEMPDWIAEGEVPAEEPVAPAEQPKDDIPDWLSGIADSMVETTVDDDFLADDAPEPVASDEVAREEAPDWLREFAGLTEEAPVTESKVDEPDIDMQSLRQLEQEIGADEGEGSTPETLGVTDEVDDDEVFRWLEDLAETQEEEESIAVVPPAESPIGVPQDSAPMISETVPPEETDESLQWLENLASQRGMDIDVSPTAPEGLPGKTDDSPDWLREMASGSADETLVSMPTPTPVEDIDTGIAEEQVSEIAPSMEPSIPEVTETPLEEEPMPEIPGWLDEASSVAEAVPPEPEQEISPPAIEDELLPPEPRVVEEPAEVESPPMPALVPTPEPPVVEVPAEIESPPVPAVVPAPEPVPPIPAVKEDALESTPVEPAEEIAPSKYQEPASQLLMGARQALTAGDAGRALSDYKKLIERKQDLDTVISDLESALERYPNLPTMWQALGDAYMKADKLQEAIKAYQRGMEVA